ncbi:MAG: PLP-dependent aminotransferase family protein [Anaerovoracaceae bacterium]|nr:PLP-dependent aminotransferase family protein [Anaerovoracaceae bacterium]
MPVNSFDDYPMSWRPRLEKKGRTLYKELADTLEKDIRSGKLMPGTKMPPMRELADYLDINVSTVLKAFRQCEMNGLLSSKAGSGTFVPYDVMVSGRLVEDASAIAPDEGIIDMGATVPEPSANDTLMRMMREIMAEEGMERLFGLSSASEAAWQKTAAAVLMERCGKTTHPQNILTTQGGQNAITGLLASMFHRGDRIAVEDHTYPGIKSAAAMFGLHLVPVPADDRGMIPEALRLACGRDKIRGVYLVTATNNPTTVTMPEDRRKEIADIIENEDCFLIEDGTYQLMKPGMKSMSEMIPGRSAYILTISKVIAPGMRIAYLALPEEYVKTVSDTLYSINISAVPLMAELAARVAAAGEFENILENHRKNTIKRNAVVGRYLPPQFCRGGGSDIFRWLILPSGMSGTRFAQLCEHRGVIVYPAEKFAVGNTKPLPAVRLSICSPGSAEDLEKGVRVVSELMNEKFV